MVPALRLPLPSMIGLTDGTLSRGFRHSGVEQLEQDDAALVDLWAIVAGLEE